MGRTFASYVVLCCFTVSTVFSPYAQAEGSTKQRTPAQAQNDGLAAKIENAKITIGERLKTLKTEGVKILDNSGKEVSLEEFASNPAAFKDGVTLMADDHRLAFKAELLGNGESGIKFFVSHSFRDQPVDSGQVITISPGLTKKAIQQRFEDAIQSVMISMKAVTSNKGAAQRDVASASAYKWFWCGLTGVCLLLAIGSLTLKGIDKKADGFVSGLVLAGITGYFCKATD